MGVLSVALDTELDRSIALKEIRESAANDAGYRARFLAEAEITGKLEHPGIIPIYGLGTYADGRPFYAMRLIRGDKTGSLLDAIRRFHGGPDRPGKVVEFRGLLRRFLDVCNAVAYAHNKGVLHRDLKPENILLGPYGETLVVDWGLAKAASRADPASTEGEDRVRLNLSGSGLSPTIAGGPLGTPGYAASRADDRRPGQHRPPQRRLRAGGDPLLLDGRPGPDLAQGCRVGAVHQEGRRRRFPASPSNQPRDSISPSKPSA